MLNSVPISSEDKKLREACDSLESLKRKNEKLDEMILKLKAEIHSLREQNKIAYIAGYDSCVLRIKQTIINEYDERQEKQRSLDD